MLYMHKNLSVLIKGAPIQWIVTMTPVLLKGAIEVELEQFGDRNFDLEGTL